jgi:hypothetical protein
MRLAGVVFLILACAGCGGSGAAPTAPSLPVRQPPTFLTGQYYLQLTAYDFSDNPLVPACAAYIGVPHAGKFVTVALTVVRENSDWVGRPAPGTGDLELRFHDAGIVGFGERTFSGTLRGRATDQEMPFSPLPSNGVTVSVSGSGPGGAAVIEGRTAFVNNANTLTGRALGQFRFEDEAGVAATCGTVSVHIIVPNIGT